jgi:PAS domain S-box-containing protein
MKIKNIGLIGRIAFLVAIVEILAFSIMGYLYSDRFTYFLEKDTKDRLHQINMMIASEELPISSVTQKGFMSNMLGHEFLDGYIVGNNGFIIVSSRSEFLGREFQDIPNYSEQWNIKKAGEVYFQNGNILTSVSHLKNQEQEIPLYHAILSINTQKLIEAKNKIILYGIAGSLLFIILSSAAIIFFAQKFVIQRIDDSLEILHKAEQGILNTYIPITHEDELGKLQKGINSMIEQVGKLLLEYKSSVQEVKKAQQETLEEQEKLKNLNERFELTLDAVNDGIWDWEVNTDTTYFSKRWKSMLGYEDDDIENTGSAFFKLIHKDYKELVKEAIENHFKDPIKYPYSMEIKVKCKDGSYKWILARGKVFFDESGDPKRMLGYHSDITKDKENEEYLAQQNKIMEEQSKLASMGEMIGNIAHQWRQPLSTITTAATGMEFESDMDL